MNTDNPGPLADVMIDALEQAGLDPLAVADNKMCQICVREVAQGRWSIRQFVANVKKLAIINPRLKRQPTVITTVGVISNESKGDSTNAKA